MSPYLLIVQPFACWLLSDSRALACVGFNVLSMRSMYPPSKILSILFGKMPAEKKDPSRKRDPSRRGQIRN